MADMVDELLSKGSWHRLLPIREPGICMLTLEMLSSFEFDRSYSLCQLPLDSSFASIDAIHFRAFHQYYRMSVMQFSIQLGLYDEDYIVTEEYE